MYHDSNFRLNQLDGYYLLHDGIQALARAERVGIRIDTDVCQSRIKELDDKVARLTEIFSQTKLGRRWGHKFGKSTNYDSDQQLAVMLFEELGLEAPKKTDSGKDSTDEETLRALGLPELDTLITIRKTNKVSGTYLQSYMRETVDGILHPFYSLNTVTTFRSSSQNPNLQNVPIRDEESMEMCRSVIFAHRGHHLVEIDFSGVEVGCAACYHKDPVMLKYLFDPKSDMHGDTAYDLFKLETFDAFIKENGGVKKMANGRLRQAAKNGFVFPEFYGDYYGNCAVNTACVWGKLPPGKWSKSDGIMLPGEVSLGEHLISQGIRSLEAYTEHVKQVEDHFWSRRFKVYNAWRKKWFEDYQRNGYIDMLTGFRCSGVMRRNEVVNYGVQGAAFHWLLKTLIETDKIMVKEKWISRIVGEIHDSMLLSVHPDELYHVVKTVKHIAEVFLPKFYPWINVPINVEVKMTDIDRPWSEIKEIKDWS